MPAPLKPHRVTVPLQAAHHTDPSSGLHAGVMSVPQDAPELSEAVETYDLVIIGSGPAGLATLARALESRPGALYTDDERRHLHWLQRSSRPQSSLLHFQFDKKSGEPQAVRQSRESAGIDKNGRVLPRDEQESPGCTHIPRQCPCPRVLVIDKSGKGWAGQYRSLMDAYEIKFLRSPMFFHPSPGDHDDLLAYAARVGWDTCASPSQVPMGQGGYAPPTSDNRGAPPQVLSAAERRRMRKGARVVPGLQDVSGENEQPHLLEIPGIVGTGLSKHRRKKLVKKSRGQSNSHTNMKNDENMMHDGPEAEESLRPHGDEDAMMKRALGVNVNERAREDFFAPSTPLFFRFCDEDIVQRLGMPSGFSQSQHGPATIELPQQSAPARQGRGKRSSKRSIHRNVEAPSVVPVAEASETKAQSMEEPKLWPTYDEVLQTKGGNQEHTPQGTVVTLARGTVTDLAWYEDGGCECATFASSAGESGAFALRLDSGQVIATSSVVSAVGPGGVPNLPPAIKQTALLKQEEDTMGGHTECQDLESASPVTTGDQVHVPPISTPGHGPGWCHSLALADPNCALPPPHVKALMADPLRRDTTALLVIGGGLTSAQIVDMCLRHNYFDRVHLIMRGPLKSKPIDVGHEWLGKFSNLQKMRFWQEDTAEMRWEMIKEARNGGAVTPNYARVLAYWEKTGRLQVHTFTTLESFAWSEERQEADLKLCSKRIRKVAAEAPGRKQRRGAHDYDDDISQDLGSSLETPCDISSNEEVKIDLTVNYVVSATGQAINFAGLPFTRRLMQQHPISVIPSGLPVVNEDLQWSSDIPFFVVGAYAALQVGPGAYNLIGIREAADRVAVRLTELANTVLGTNVPATTAEAQDEASTEAPHQEEPPSRFTHFGFELLGEA